MTDKVIKKAVACCFDCTCQKCPYKEKANCEELLKQDLFNLLDQNTAEIERLKAQVVVLQGWGLNNG